MTAPKDPSRREEHRARDALRKTKTPEGRARAEARLANVLAGTTDLPEGHRLRGSSVLTGADGQLESRWDKTERDTTAAATTELPPQFAI
jgi:hypothetical protein